MTESNVHKSFQHKLRTKKEVDEDYTREAIWLGHKSRILNQMNQDIEKMEDEIEGHLNKLMELNQEGMKVEQQEAILKQVEEAKANPPVLPPNETVTNSGDQNEIA